MFEYIIHPDSHEKLIEISNSNYIFNDGTVLPIHNNIPILFGKDSIFEVNDIINSKITTQNSKHLDKNNFKNFIRRSILPTLSKDFYMKSRYKNLSQLVNENSKILIVGVGEKSEFYRSFFPNCKVITSDVHSQFAPDFVFDGHFIPFADQTFDLVLAAQVIEHTINPWKFCAELQRVTKLGGLLQIEAPSNFPFHAEPYDFFRFTYTGFRSLFSNCEVKKSSLTEGGASMLAVSISNYLINRSSNKYIRQVILFKTRILFGWLKYLDLLNVNLTRRSISMPMGYAFTFRKDNKIRTSKEMLIEYYNLKK